MPKSRTTSWRAFRPDAAETSARVPIPAVRCRILGLDPGSQRTGYGFVACDGPDYVHIVHGHIDVAKLEMAARMRRIFEVLSELITKYQPDEVAIERVFVSRNVDSALKLGQARGAALAAVTLGTSVYEYAPREIKLAVVGFGGAEKTQVAHMITRLLHLEGDVQPDAADALAVALCHAHSRRLRQLAAQALAGAR